jgi:hypothetical protein
MVPTFRCDFRYLPAPATRSRRWLVGSADHCMQAADLETEAQAPVKVARTALPSQSVSLTNGPSQCPVQHFAALSDT